MDRVLSTRIDDAVFRQINDLSVKMHTSKKAIIERAVRLLGQQSRNDKEKDIFDDTCGAWKRDETPEATVARAKKAFRESMTRGCR